MTGYSETLISVLGDNRCRRCGKHAEEIRGKRPLIVHHRDSNRANNDPANLEILCHTCHKEAHRRGPIQAKELDQRLRKRKRDPYRTTRVAVYAHPEWVRLVDENRRYLTAVQRRRVSRSEYIVMAVNHFMEPYNKRRSAYRMEFMKRQKERENESPTDIPDPLERILEKPPSKSYVKSMSLDGQALMRVGENLIDGAYFWGIVRGEVP